MDQETSQRCAKHVDQDTGNGKLLRKDVLFVSSYVTDSGGRNARLWSPKIPKKKRSRVVYKKTTVSPMKEFHLELLAMWKIYGNPTQSSPEEILLFNNVNNFIPNNEIGLGAVLLNPNDISA